MERGPHTVVNLINLAFNRLIKTSIFFTLYTPHYIQKIFFLIYHIPLLKRYTHKKNKNKTSPETPTRIKFTSLYSQNANKTINNDHPYKDWEQHEIKLAKYCQH